MLGDVPFPAIVGWALDAFAPAICAGAHDATSNATALAADAGGRVLGGVGDRGHCTHDANGVRVAITIAHGWEVSLIVECWRGSLDERHTFCDTIATLCAPSQIWPVLFWAAAMYFARHALTLAAASTESASAASAVTVLAAQDHSRGQGEGGAAEGAAAEEVQGGRGRGGRYGTDVPSETRLLPSVPDAPAAR